MNELPFSINRLVDELAAIPDVVAVVLGGSRAFGTHDADSDWDIGLYYRKSIDLSVLSKYGVVYPPGSWGRIMNGGAWLQLDGQRVDVILRDLDTVEHWLQRANEGDFEVDALLGYIAGAPTYLLVAELESCRVLRGAIPVATFPPTLAGSAPARWRFCRSFSLAYARTLAARGNVVGATGQAAKAAMEEAHARLCERSEWVCNEKRLIDAAGLAETHELFRRAPSDSAKFIEWLDAVGACLGIARDEAAPWMAQ